MWNYSFHKPCPHIHENHHLHSATHLNTHQQTADKNDLVYQCVDLKAKEWSWSAAGGKDIGSLSCHVKKNNSVWTSHGLFQEATGPSLDTYCFQCRTLVKYRKSNSPGDKKAAEAATVKFGHLCSSQLVFLHAAEPSHDKKLWHHSWAISPTCTSTPTPPPTHYSLEWWMWWVRWHCSVLTLQMAAPFWHILASSLTKMGS